MDAEILGNLRSIEPNADQRPYRRQGDGLVPSRDAANPAKLSHPVNLPTVIDLTTHFN